MKPYYQHAGITIYHGDCREILPRVNAPDCVFITDPPYGISYVTCRGRGSVKGYASWAYEEIQGDATTELREWLIYNCRNWPMAIFGSWKIQRPPDISAVLIWDKGPAFGMGDLGFPWKCSFEEIYILGSGWKGRRDEGVIKGHIVVSWESKGRSHPTEKPVSLIQHLANKHMATMVVDPFCGTGASLIAAKNIGKRAIGIEIEEKYCEIAAKRLSQEVFDFENRAGGVAPAGLP